VRVTVFGATGVIGQALLPQLADEHEVVAVSRGRREAEDGIRWTEADVASGTGIAAALEQAEIAYYLVHSLGARDFERQDREAARNVSREAKRAGVEQIVYLGGLGGEDDDASAHLRSRRETADSLASDGVPVTTLRAAMVVGKGSAAFETILGLVRRLPVMITPSWVSRLFVAWPRWARASPTREKQNAAMPTTSQIGRPSKIAASSPIPPAMNPIWPIVLRIFFPYIWFARRGSTWGRDSSRGSSGSGM